MTRATESWGLLERQRDISDRIGDLLLREVAGDVPLREIDWMHKTANTSDSRVIFVICACFK